MGHRNQFCVDAPGLGKFVCDAAHARAYEVRPGVLPELVFVHNRALSRLDSAPLTAGSSPRLPTGGHPWRVGVT